MRTKTCHSYAVGHTVHFIQWKKAFQDPEGQVPIGRISIHGDAIVLVAGTEELHYLNHDLRDIRERIATKARLEVFLHRRWSVLTLNDYNVSVRAIDRGPLGPCPTGDWEGGFLVPMEPPA